uniref:Odorant receptor n=1 Tax=Heliothis virescens TaxID=7102 RepID=A0A2A4JGV3_HELVI
MIFVCGQFSLLRDYSAQIGGKGRQCNLSMRRDERARFRIIRCHEIYLLLVNSITELDMLLNNIIGVYFFVATLTLCSVAVRLKTEDMGVMQLVSLIQYMCGTLTQLFLFCRYGDAVLHEFSLLRDYSAQIGGKGRQCNLSMRRDERARFRIIRCHEIYLLLVNSITELDMLLNNIIGVYFFVATLTLCSVAVRLKTEDMGVMQLVSLIQYMCGTLTQLFLFCRYGDAVLHESAMRMGEGPFAAATWCLSPRIRRDLSMLSAGMMSQRHLRAGPFSFIDLPSFIQVVRAAYSYYAVLGKKE